jgi:predicted chitinase
MIPLTTAQLNSLAPNAKANYRTAFETADEVFAKYGINDSALRLRHFMAQILHETGALTILTESLNYRAERLLDVWPTRFKTVADATPFAHNPEALANNVYGGRMGNVDPGDGWKYIGRGLMQITGRESYERYGQALGIDLAGNPDFATDPQYTLAIAAEEWVASKCNDYADADDIRRVTKAINGGYIGLAERQAWLGKTAAIWA